MPHQKSWSEISGQLLMKSTWYIFVFIQTLLTYIIKLSWRKALILFYSLSINTINSLFVNTLKTLIHVYKWVSNLVSNSSLHKHTIRLSIGTNILIHIPTYFGGKMNSWRTIMYIFKAFSLTLVYYDLRAAVSAFHKKTFVLHSSGTCIQWAKKWKVMNKNILKI